ncbi:MAG: tRNA (N(6)-L-threonylcarbamoyladenosine(37)-C(2))-methylthiotransferase MtaB [Thermodesulfovibrionia bacterium]
MRIAIQTIGCKVNQSESAFIEGALIGCGHEIVDYNDSPDLCIVNTCTVTSKADYQSRQLIRRAIRNGAKVIATGCYAQLRADEVLGIEGVISVIGNYEKEKIISNINRLFDHKERLMDVSPSNGIFFSEAYHSKRARAFLKIQDGCNRSCSYCIIPLARGKNRSMSPHDVLKAVQGLYSLGYQEIVLTGIHIGSYGIDLEPKSSLVEIIKDIKSHYPTPRIRLSSIEPDEVNDEVLSLMNDNLICPHLHIPIQSGSDRILSSMNRGYTRDYIRRLINKIVSINPDVSIGTDIIVGFPGEGDEEFKLTYQLLEELPFSYIHVFPYSKRKGTVAVSLPYHVSHEIKRQRVESINGLAREKRISYISRYKDKVLDVIIEGRDSNTGYYKGISSNYIRVLVKDNGLKPYARTLVRGISFNNNALICEPEMSL